MQIVCPSCATSYQIEPTVLGAGGRSVRCVRCHSVWFAQEEPHPPPTNWDDVTVADEAAEAGLPTDAPDVAFASNSDLPAGFGAGEADPPAEEAAATSEPPFADDAPSLAGPYRHDEMPRSSYEPLAMDDAPAAVRMQRGEIGPAIEPTLGEDIETFAVRQAKRQRARPRKSWPSSILPTALAALLVANVMMIVWRSDVVKLLPQTASLYAAIGLPVNLRGLSFNNITTTTEAHDGVSVLVVEGNIGSTSSRVVEVPRLRLSLRNRSGHEIYAWTVLPGRSLLPPGETLAFRSRLASPPADGHDVIVRFFNRRDLVAGLQ
jgi:predicted Zn finger-like uncharacterized protein